MQKFESINAIVEEFQFKKTTLAIFGLDELYHQGTKIQFGDFEPVHTDNVIEIVFEEEDPSFCSIFADDSTMDTQSTLPTQNTQVLQVAMAGTSAPMKLVSDGDILSSEFELDRSEPFLLSELD